MGDDVLLRRPETNTEELQSALEEAILRLHVLERQRASAKHALLDVDIGPQERAELRGVLAELAAEARKLAHKKILLEEKLTACGVELPAPTLRIIDHGGLLEFDDGVELDTSSDADDDDDAATAAGRPDDANGAPVRRVRSSEDVHHGAASTKSPLSASSPSAASKKAAIGSSLKQRKSDMMAKGYADRPTALPQLRRNESGPLSPKRPLGQAPTPPTGGGHFDDASSASQ